MGSIINGSKAAAHGTTGRAEEGGVCVRLQGYALHYHNWLEKGGLEGVVEDGGVEMDVTALEEVVHGTGGDQVGGGAGEDLAVGGDEP